MLDHKNDTVEKIDSIPSLSQGLKCPRCKSKHQIRNGKDHGTQKFKCKNCGKGYRRSTGSPLYRLRKIQLIPNYIECIDQALSLRKTAKTLKISYATAFAWRHKLLSALKENKLTTDNTNLSISILKLPYSNKGIRTKSIQSTKHTQTLIIQNGQGEAQIAKLPTKRLTAEIRKIVQESTANVNIAIKAKNKQLAHALPRTAKIDTFENQHFDNLRNKQIQQLHDWLSRFRGVSSKYLQHYWNWHTTQSNNIEQLIWKCLGNTESYWTYQALKKS